MAETPALSLGELDELERLIAHVREADVAFERYQERPHKEFNQETGSQLWMVAYNAQKALADYCDADVCSRLLTLARHGAAGARDWTPGLLAKLAAECDRVGAQWAPVAECLADANAALARVGPPSSPEQDRDGLYYPLLFLVRRIEQYDNDAPTTPPEAPNDGKA